MLGIEATTYNPAVGKPAIIQLVNAVVYLFAYLYLLEIALLSASCSYWLFNQSNTSVQDGAIFSKTEVKFNLVTHASI